MKDVYDLPRFITAQDQVYAAVLDELRAGEKRSHWMWYIFPQIKGLGQSVTAQKFAITSHEEAKAYLEHPLLGSRLTECTELVMSVAGRSAEQIFQYPDHLKFRSCMTLFSETTIKHRIFHDALLKCFQGKPDQATLDILRRSRL